MAEHALTSCHKIALQISGPGAPPCSNYLGGQVVADRLRLILVV
ncbi:hypothetical protein SAMN05518861_102456 [Mesorhizobium sp. YR577]|nr:hypothetical protein SAMN05518861_102456 [Mesorhizobium sp. YR577]